jgi:hypothetical protein
MKSFLILIVLVVTLLNNGCVDNCTKGDNLRKNSKSLFNLSKKELYEDINEVKIEELFKRMEKVYESFFDKQAAQSALFKGFDFDKFLPISKAICSHIKLYQIRSTHKKEIFQIVGTTLTNDRLELDIVEDSSFKFIRILNFLDGDSLSIENIDRFLIIHKASNLFLLFTNHYSRSPLKKAEYIECIYLLDYQLYPIKLLYFEDEDKTLGKLAYNFDLVYDKKNFDKLNFLTAKIIPKNYILGANTTLKEILDLFRNDLASEQKHQIYLKKYYQKESKIYQPIWMYPDFKIEKYNPN